MGLSLKGLLGTTSVGPKGVFQTTSIPGTGLSRREKIGGNNRKNTRVQRQSSTKISPESMSFVMEIEVDEETGADTLRLKTVDGNSIYDDALIRKVKKTEQYKNRLKETIEKVCSKVNEGNEIFVNIHKFSTKIITFDEIQSKFDLIRPQKYTRKVYEIQRPDEDSVRRALYIYAKENIKSLLFWKTRKLRRNYVINNLETTLADEIKKWENSKQNFEIFEECNEIEYNKRYLEEYNQEKANFEKIASGDDEYIESSIEQEFSSIKLPVEFNISYESKKSVVNLDVDLPEIEDFPNTKAEILASGKLSIKKKPKSELNRDYATNVFGLAFYFASIVFNISPKIEKINIAGYTQRMNKKTGLIEDQYVYYIEFTRNIFSKLNIVSVDPIEAVDNFKNTKSINAKYELKTINYEGKKE